MKSGMSRHFKIRRLMTALNINRAEAVGIICMLHEFVGEQAPTGGLLQDHITEIASWIEYPVEHALELAEILADCGWLDKVEYDNYMYSVHDWKDHCPDYIKKRVKRNNLDLFDDVYAADKVRQRGGQWRTKSASVADNGGQCPPHAKNESGDFGKNEIAESHVNSSNNISTTENSDLQNGGQSPPAWRTMADKVRQRGGQCPPTQPNPTQPNPTQPPRDNVRHEGEDRETVSENQARGEGKENFDSGKKQSQPATGSHTEKNWVEFSNKFKIDVNFPTSVNLSFREICFLLDATQAKERGESIKDPLRIAKYRAKDPKLKPSKDIRNTVSAWLHPPPKPGVCECGGKLENYYCTGSGASGWRCEKCQKSYHKR